MSKKVEWDELAKALRSSANRISWLATHISFPYNDEINEQDLDSEIAYLLEIKMKHFGGKG